MDDKDDTAHITHSTCPVRPVFKNMEMDDDELAALLRKLDLMHWADALAHEELSLPLMRSMGVSLQANLLELIETPSDEAFRLAEAILSERAPVFASCRGGIPALQHSSDTASSFEVPDPLPQKEPEGSDVSATASPTHCIRVASLQDEFFADDLVPPADSQLWTEAQLRAFFESGGGVRPLPSGGEVIGVLPIRWHGTELRYSYDSAATVGQFRAWLEEQTGVPPAGQKLVGLSSSVRPPPSEECLAGLVSAGGAKRSIMLVGSRPGVIEAAALDLERGRRAGVTIANDLNDMAALHTSRATAAARGRPRLSRLTDSGRPIEAQRGAGIYLDPSVWAPSVDENSRGPAYAGTFEERHVRNPRTGRLERLSLANALLGGDAVAAGQGVETPFRPEHAAPNVDLTGQIRGRCTSCTRCTGYERLDRNADNENDVEVLRCTRCGCQNHRHEAL